MNVPLVDLKAQYQPFKDAVLADIAEILDGMWLFLGENVQAFEDEFAALCDVDHAVGVSEGTTALQLALMACGVGHGDEVITVSHTFVATSEAVILAGATPVFVDVDPQMYTIDVSQIEGAITPQTKAIMPVHLYGQPADMDPIMDIADQHGLWVIEDACQAHGARYKGRRTGGLGHMGAYSFYFSKNLGAYGEAGMVTTNDDELAEKVRMLRDHGSPEKYRHEMVGLNGRLDEIQAAILRHKLPHLDAWNEKRRARADLYTELLSNVDELVPPRVADYAEHAFHLYVARIPQRDQLKAYLNDRNVGAGIHYPTPCHLQPALSHLGYSRGDFPVSEAVTEQIISLPIYPEMSPEQVEYVVDNVRAFYKDRGSNPSPRWLVARRPSRPAGETW